MLCYVQDVPDARSHVSNHVLCAGLQTGKHTGIPINRHSEPIHIGSHLSKSFFCTGLQTGIVYGIDLTPLDWESKCHCDTPICVCTMYVRMWYIDIFWDLRRWGREKENDLSYAMYNIGTIADDLSYSHHMWWCKCVIAQKRPFSLWDRADV